VSFFKVPLDRLFKRLNFEPHTAQREIIRLLEQHKFTVVAAGRRFGKSELAAHLAFAKLLEPGTRVGIVAPNFNLSNIIFDIVARIIKETGIETVKFSYKDKYIELDNGSWFKGLSAHKPDSLVGRGYDLLILDEYALTADLQSIWELQLRATLSDNPNSKAMFISSPRGNNFYKTLYGYGKSDDHPNWICYHAPTSANPYIPKKEIEEARSTLSPERFSQEYLAEFVSFAGQIYRQINIMDIKDTINLDNFEIIAGLDFGFNHSTAAVVVATDGEYFLVLEDYKVSGATTEDHANWFHVKMNEYDISNIYKDSAAAQSGYDFALLYDICTINANKSVNDGIAALQGLFNNNKLVIDTNCTDLILELENYAWKETSAGQRETPVKINDDLCDALRYAVYTFLISQARIES